MRRFLLAGSFLLLPIFAFSAPAQSTHKATSDACNVQARAILHALRDGRFDAGRIANFSTDMKAALAAQMSQFWSLLSVHYGGFDHAGTAKMARKGGERNVALPLYFAHGRENLHITCNAAGKAIGLFLTPAGNAHSEE